MSDDAVDKARREANQTTSLAGSHERQEIIDRLAKVAHDEGYKSGRDGAFAEAARDLRLFMGIMSSNDPQHVKVEKIDAVVSRIQAQVHMEPVTLSERLAAARLAGIEQGRNQEREQNIDARIAASLAAAREQGRREGVEQGLRMYAWWKDGTEWVGTCGTTLKDAIARLRRESEAKPRCPTCGSRRRKCYNSPGCDPPPNISDSWHREAGE